MFKGAKNYTSKQNKIIRYASILVPIIMILYSFFIKLRVIDPIHPVDDQYIYVFGLWWIVIILIQLISPPKLKLDHKLMLIACHLLAAACLVFISGIASPMAAVWIIYMIFSYIYFEKKGLMISTASFFAVVLLDIILWHNIGPYIISYDIITSAIIFTGGLMILLGMNFGSQKEKPKKHLLKKR